MRKVWLLGKGRRLVCLGVVLVAVCTLLHHLFFGSATALPQSPAAQCNCHGPSPIMCSIEEQHNVSCLLDNQNQEVFVPFYSFLQNQFDVTGKLLERSNGAAVFEWSQSYARLFASAVDGYSVQGVFGPFASYNVENRDKRVRCISAEYGVPMSVQWQPQPYYYVIQVAQFALQHYSKNLTEAPVISIVDASESKWIRNGGAADSIRTIFDADVDSQVVVIESKDAAGVRLALDEQQRTQTVLVAQLMLESSDAALIVVIMWNNLRGDQAGLFQQQYWLKYEQAPTTDCVREMEPSGAGHITFVYSLGTDTHRKRWFTFTRNLLNDLHRAIVYLRPDEAHKKIRHVQLVSLTVSGRVAIRQQIYQQSSAHVNMFLDGARYILQSQDEQGGWPIQARRVLSKTLVLEPGWYSAMAQGHAISVLCRAYLSSGLDAYLLAAINALKLFDTQASAKGVRNDFYGQFVWYEEYPTQPGSFVLNGFIYSLIGLFDLRETLNIVAGRPAELQVDGGLHDVARLIEQAMQSLRQMLPLYDTGARSLYDLRHVGLRSAAPNIARWDYHALHVYQLRWLAACVHNDADHLLLNSVADRWAAYARGRTAKHN